MRVVDSWLATDGAVYNLDAHLRRWQDGCRQVFGTEPPEVAVRTQRAGRWFPQVWFDGQTAGMDWRPAPARRSVTRLWIPPCSDERCWPTVKGPDMPWQLGLRAQARNQGCDDAVLHRDGWLVEAACGTIVYEWRGQLCVPPGPRLASVTLTRLPAVIERPVEIAQLAHLNAWWLSSLHGVTPVSAWVPSTPWQN